ncbi:hypothetical protein QTN24_16695 [Cupriavidus sp. SZY C1]|uniref:hypothetical protein n=1 Tax=Cupriavidus sp. SZY C1 TaxID=3055037 RepID=UPI0028BB0532|nr:hypothetical protein [Cupriavidus sp. SZY C1]MDT6963139.1 hypothetical protein [Cupriavidus sp. SZY C1]
MKQHLAKSLLMAGALVASYPLLAQQMAPVQQAQPMPAPSAAPSSVTAQPVQAAPAAGYAAPAAPAAASPYAQGSMESVQRGVPPAPGAMSMAPPPAPAAVVDPAAMSLPPDALGTRLGQRNRFLDGA